MHSYFYTRCIIFYVLTRTIFVVDAQDIFDIFNDYKNQIVEKVEYSLVEVKEHKDNETSPSTFTNEYRTVLTAYRHLVKDWIEKFPSKNAEEYRLSIKLSPNEFNRLDEFASSSAYAQQDVLHHVHIISDLLKRIVYKIEEDKLVFSGLTWSAWLRSFDSNLIINGILILIIIGSISFISLRTPLRRGLWFTTFFIVTFVISVVLNWYTLYQEAQAKIDEVLMKKLPEHCQNQSIGIFNMFTAHFRRLFQSPNNECLEYHKALRATPHAQVTPVQALSLTLAQLFITPMGVIGESLSQFFAGTMRHVPIILWPAIIILILIIFIVLTLIYSRYEVHLPFMMGYIRPSSHAAITRTTAIVEQIEGTTAQSQNYVQELENQVKELQMKLEEKTNLSLEHNTT